MRNIMANEYLKLKRNRLFLVCTITAILIPCLAVIIDLMDKEDIISLTTSSQWMSNLIIPVQIMVYPILSGLVVTFLFQKEYTERTLINTLTAATSRTGFILSKYIIWSIWSLLITSCFLAIISVGAALLFGIREFQAAFPQIAQLILKTGTLHLLSTSPILFICIQQKTTFYPSILFNCIAAGISFAGLYWPESIRNIVPWSAVTSITILNDSKATPFISIAICYIIGLLLSIYTFKKQDL